MGTKYNYFPGAHNRGRYDWKATIRAVFRRFVPKRLKKNVFFYNEARKKKLHETGTCKISGTKGFKGT